MAEGGVGEVLHLVLQLVAWFWVTSVLSSE